MAIQGFEKSFYLEQKLAQLQQSAPDTWGGRTVTDLDNTLQNDFGLTAEQHYEQYGYQEGLSPNEFFNPTQYIAAKATAMFNAEGSSYDSAADAAQAFVDLWGGNVYEHYLQYGASEGINPSNRFDQSAYLQEKLTQLQSNGDTQYQNVADVQAAFQAAGLTPLTHFIAYGRDEGLTAVEVPGEGNVDLEGLTQALASYQSAVAARFNFLLENAGNSLLAETPIISGLGDGVTPTAAQVATAIDQADTVADQAVVTAQTAVQDAQDVLDVARAARIDSITDDGSIVGESGDIAEAIAALNTFNNTTLLRDATLVSARTEAQAAVAADTGVYNADGSSVIDADATADNETSFTAAQLQARVTQAQAAVTNFDAANGDDAALLGSLRTAINAHFSAGGQNAIVEVNTGGGEDVTLQSLRSALDGALNGVADAQGVSTLLETIGGYTFSFEAATGQTLTAQQTAINAAFTNIDRSIELDGDVTAAQTAFGGTDVGGVLNTVIALQEDRQGLIDDVTTAQTELSDAQTLAASTQALVDQLDTLDTSIETALATLNDPESEGGFGVELRDFVDNSDATADSDLYVFADDVGQTINIDNFGDSGVDSIFFGEGYTLVALGENQTINQRVGSASELEIFYKQDGANLNLYVEADAEAGRDLDTDAITTIALTGVDASEIQLTGGLLSAGSNTVEVA